MNGLGKRASVPLRTGSDHLLAEVARASSFCPAAIPSGTGAKRVMLWSGNIYPGYSAVNALREPIRARFYFAALPVPGLSTSRQLVSGSRIGDRALADTPWDVSERDV